MRKGSQTEYDYLEHSMRQMKIKLSTHEKITDNSPFSFFA